jgi:hypothetical protein
MNRWHCSVFLSCWLISTGASPGASAQNAEVTAPLIWGSKTDPTDFTYYEFEDQNADGFLKIRLTLGRRRVEECKVLYRTKLTNKELTPVRACDYNPVNGTLSVDFKNNSVGLVALKGHLTAMRHKVLWQRVFESALSFVDKSTIRLDAKESGHYLLQNKPKCELIFANDRPGEPHEFRVGPKRIEITLAYARDNEAFIRQWVGAQGGKLLTRDTNYADNVEKYGMHLPKTIDILEVLDHLSSDERVLCVSYDDVRE